MTTYRQACESTVHGSCGYCRGEIPDGPIPGVPVTLNAPPNDTGTLSGSGFIADTPENRAALEKAAIPKCRAWREANPECVSSIHGGHLYIKSHCVDPTHQGPAPYCCSAYCDRCAGLRALNGDDRPLLPNEWMQP